MSHPQEHWTPVQTAYHGLIHGYELNGKRGAYAWAEIRDRSPNSISNEANPDYQSAKFGIDDAIQAELQAGIFPILHAHARMTGHICFRLPNPDLPLGDAALLDRFAAWQSAMGTTCEEIRLALDPNGPSGTGIARGEAESIAAAGYRHMQRFMVFLEELKSIQEPS